MVSGPSVPYRDGGFGDIRLAWHDGSLSITLSRPGDRNSLRAETLQDCHAALDHALAEPACRTVVLLGEGDAFCTGLDFATSRSLAPESVDDRIGYAALLRRLSEAPVITIAAVDGAVLAGGVGLAAACDVVIATPRSSFRLTEAIWGILPANVAPYLIRRVGFQAAYHMALTTMPLSLDESIQRGLVDHRADRLAPALKRYALAAKRQARETIGEMKNLFRSMWYADAGTYRKADAEMMRSLQKPEVRRNVQEYLETGRFPWEDGSHA